jgi:guanylate kinase
LTGGIYMLLALAGVTGVGKSYYKDQLVEKLGFEKVKIITTRAPREGEKNNEDKIFVSPRELQDLRDTGKIAFEFDLLGNTYAYTYEDLHSDKNTVFELHYDTIFDFKKVCPHLCVIYLFPKDIELAKDKTRQRHLAPLVEQDRLLEIDEHYKRITTDEHLRNQFDYFLYNDYDQTSEEAFLTLVRKLIEEKDI